MSEDEKVSNVEAAKALVEMLAGLVEEHGSLVRERAWLTHIVVTLMEHTAPGLKWRGEYPAKMTHPNGHVMKALEHYQCANTSGFVKRLAKALGVETK